MITKFDFKSVRKGEVLYCSSCGNSVVYVKEVGLNSRCNKCILKGFELKVRKYASKY